MLRKALVLVVAATSCLGVRASWAASTVKKTFLPDNNWKISVAEQKGGLTEAQFNATMDLVQKVYGPIIAAHGAQLSIERDWADDTVNAYATQSGNVWTIHMYGGLARQSAVTQDGMAMVACHELGHHLGGFPKVSDWAADEGQADYFAPSKCMRRLLGNASAKSFTRPTVGKTVQQGCAAAWHSVGDQSFCERNAAAGLSLATLLAGLGGDPVPNVDTPDRSRVDTTNDAHPAAQCRLDTYFAAALCTKSALEDFSASNPNPGACTRSQGFTMGIRPRCWYKPPTGEPDPSIMKSGQTVAVRDSLQKGPAFNALQRAAGL